MASQPHNGAQDVLWNAPNGLKPALWECAEILRGSAVDRTDWKAYILPLLFFKRICDVWDEETAEAVELYGDVDPVDFPEIHRFDVPGGLPLAGRPRDASQRRRGAGARHARDRAGEPRHALPRLRRRRLGQQGDPLRRDAEGPDRGALRGAARQHGGRTPTSSATPTST